MAEAQLRQFLDKIRQLNAFVALSEADPQLRRELCDCEHHDQVVALARRCGFEIGRRWGEPPPALPPVGGQDRPPSSADLQATAVSQDRPIADPVAVAAALLSQADRPLSCLAGPCPPQGEERTDVLVETPHWRLERIHSCAHHSPEGFWYEQQEEEWVLLLQGTAALRFDDQPADQPLRQGESLRIRAGRRHRVTWTDPAPGTIWLALFWRTA